MRVIAGQFRSRRLQAPRGLDTRPTSDRLRETLFNVLGERTVGARFADLYAGSGAVGIEALSRGARHCSFAETAPAALAALRANVKALQLEGSVTVEPRGTARLLERPAPQVLPLDLVFLDPPYDDAEGYRLTLEALARRGGALLASAALVIAEHRRQQPPAARYGSLERVRLLEQGDAALSFYRMQRAD